MTEAENHIKAELRSQFLDFISMHSEDTWCASWMDGIEKEIRADKGIWLYLAYVCEGWPKGYRAHDGWEPLSTEEMQEVQATFERIS